MSQIPRMSMDGPPTSVITPEERKLMKDYANGILERLPIGKPFSGAELALAEPDKKRAAKAVNHLVRLFKVQRLRCGMLIRNA